MEGRDASYSRFLQGGNDGEREVAMVVSHQSEWPLPLANVVRLMRQVIPPNSKIAETAKWLLHDCVLEFAGLIIGEAAERCREHRRRIISPEDIVWSMQNLGFNNFVEPTSTYLRRRRQVGGGTGRAALRAAAPPAAPSPQGLQLEPPPTFSVEELEMLVKAFGMTWDGEDVGASSSVQMPPPVDVHEHNGDV